MAAEPGMPGPIHLAASLHPTVWGGRGLAAVAGKALPEGALVGESWETELGNVARNAPYAGRTLGELVAALGDDLIGARAHAVFGPRFPLLAKFLDARQRLSVQVHPDDAYAAAHEGGKLGKTECWLILRAEPGAQVVYGLRARATREQVRAAIVESRLEDLLHRFDVHPGDVIFVPAGTVHAICHGVTLYELQEYSDVTYRLYDYGRPRELHVDAALDVMRYEPPAVERVAPVALAEAKGCSRRALAACRYFVLEELRLDGPFAPEPTPGSCQIVTVLGGAGTLRWPGGALRLALGDTAVVPAALRGCSIEGESAHLVRSYVPESDDAALRAWRAAQHASFDV